MALPNPCLKRTVVVVVVVAICVVVDDHEAAAAAAAGHRFPREWRFLFGSFNLIFIFPVECFPSGPLPLKQGMRIHEIVDDWRENRVFGT